MEKKREPVSKVLLTGCYGTGNCGDEAILQSLVHLIRDHYGDIEIYVATIDPYQTKKLHGIKTTIPTVERDPVTWITSLQKVDRVFIGGGSLLGGKFVFRHGIIISLAKLLDIPVCFTSVGSGQAKSREEYWLREKNLETADVITIRDEESKHKLGLEDCNRLKVIPDPVFNKNINNKNEELELDVELPEKFLLVCGRHVKSREKFDVEELALSLDNISQMTDLEIVLIPFHNGGTHSDMEFCIDLSNQIESKSIIIDGFLEHRKIENIIRESEIIVGIRLHSIILAAKNNKPVVGISYHPKCESVLKLLGTEDPIWFDDISSKKLTRRILHRYNNKHYENKISNRSEELHNKSIKLFEEIEEMIGINTINRSKVLTLIPFCIIGIFRYITDRLLCRIARS